MQNYITTLPFKQVLLFIVIGGFLQFSFYLITHYGMPILKKKQNSISLQWNRIQIISWAIFLLLFFSSLLKANLYLTLAISVVILFIGWTFWIDIFAGMMIKFTNQFQINDNISTTLITGKVKAIKITFTEVLNSKGELSTIPNSKLHKALLKHLNKKNTLNTSTFVCSGNLSYDEAYNYALNCPYFTGNQKIKIAKDNNHEYEIKAMLLDETFKEDAVDYFKKIA